MLRCLSYSNTDLLQNLNNDLKKLKATEFKNKHLLALQSRITTSRSEKWCHVFQWRNVMITLPCPAVL